jgi:hypothetical protein
MHTKLNDYFAEQSWMKKISEQNLWEAPLFFGTVLQKKGGWLDPEYSDNIVINSNQLCTEEQGCFTQQK